MKNQYIYRYKQGDKTKGSIRQLKPEASFERYVERLKEYGQDAIRVKKPSLKALECMAIDGVASAVDGCCVEPDGICPHGFPSYLLVTGLI